MQNKSLPIMSALFWCISSGYSAAAALSVDFQPNGNPVEAGFVEQSSFTQLHTTGLGDITISFSGQQGAFNYTPNTGVAHPDLYRDFFFDNSGPMTMTLTGSGISGLTDYDMTFWAFYGAEARNTTITPISGTTGPTLGPIAYVINPTTLDDNAASGTFTSDSSGNLTFSLGSGRPAINGLTLDLVPVAAIPETSSLVLLGVGAIGVFLRRRI